MTLTWALIAVTLLVAAVSLERTRRMGKKLARLQETYWDLRYELGQLQARLNRIETERPEQVAPPAAAAGAQAFVPLSSLKRVVER